MRTTTRSDRSIAMVKREEPWLGTRAMFIVFFAGLIALWGAVSLLFYLEIP